VETSLGSVVLLFYRKRQSDITAYCSRCSVLQ